MGRFKDRLDFLICGSNRKYYKDFDSLLFLIAVLPYFGCLLFFLKKKTFNLK